MDLPYFCGPCLSQNTSVAAAWLVINSNNNPLPAATLSCALLDRRQSEARKVSVGATSRSQFIRAVPI